MIDAGGFSWGTRGESVLGHTNVGEGNQDVVGEVAMVAVDRNSWCVRHMPDDGLIAQHNGDGNGHRKVG